MNTSTMERDRNLIVDRLSSYCWAYDERRRDQLEDCFTEDAIWDGNVGDAHQIGPMRGRNAVVEWLTAFWPHQHDRRRHIVMSQAIEGYGKRKAHLLAYLFLTSAKNETVSLETTGFYRIDLVREGEEWRMRRLFGGFDAPFWPGKLENLSSRGRRRHGLEAEDR
jgi:hypothetical protein